MKRAWFWFSLVVTLVAVSMFLLSLLPAPICDKSGTTLICTDKGKQVSSARALSTVVGSPIVELNTKDLDRFIFKDGTSVDVLKAPPPYLGSKLQQYKVVALKSVVLGLLSFDSPLEKAGKMTVELEKEGRVVAVVPQPDSAFPHGAVVLVFSDAFKLDDHCGYAVIIRKHAFRVGGQQPTRFRSF